MSRIRTTAQFAVRRLDAARPAPARTSRFGALTVASLGLMLAIGLTGCSSGGSASKVASLSGASSSATAPGATGQRTNSTQQDALLKFARCMRQHGVNMPDPKATNGTNGAGALPAITAPNAAAQQKMQTAQTACASLLPNGGQASAQSNERVLKFAQCMRQHGINMPDPKATGGGVGLTLGTTNLSDPKTKAAMNACASGMVPGSSTSSG